MNAVRAIEFTDALGRLQGMLGRRVRILVNFHGTFGGCSLEGKLSRVETLPPDHCAINVLIDDRQGLLLDPVDTEVLLVGDPEDDAASLDFHLPFGVAVSLEAI
jgi:hypothetical protein